MKSVSISIPDHFKKCTQRENSEISIRKKGRAENTIKKIKNKKEMEEVLDKAGSLQ